MYISRFFCMDWPFSAARLPAPAELTNYSVQPRLPAAMLRFPATCVFAALASLASICVWAQPPTPQQTLAQPALLTANSVALTGPFGPGSILDAYNKTPQALLGTLYPVEAFVVAMGQLFTGMEPVRGLQPTNSCTKRSSINIILKVRLGATADSSSHGRWNLVCSLGGGGALHGRICRPFLGRAAAPASRGGALLFS